MILSRARLALRIKTTAYDAELASLIMAAADDLRLVGIPVYGVSVSVSYASGEPVVSDTSTLTDELLIRAIITYVRMNFGSPADYDRLKAAYDEQKAQLRLSSAYGLHVEDL